MPDPRRTPRPSSSAAALSALDPAFLSRVYVASAALALVLGAFIAFYHHGSWGLGFILAALWSTVNLWALARVFQLALRPHGRDGKAILVAGLVKIPVLYGLLLLLVARGGFPAGALLSGFSVPFLVIFLRAAGRALMSPSRQSSNTSRSPRLPSS